MRTPAHHRSSCIRAKLGLVAALAALSLAAGCAERSDPAEEGGVTAHTPEWNQPASADFHGTRVEQTGATSCTGCHGADYAGSANVPGCYGCHDGPGGHPGGWASPQSTAFHGDDVAAHGPTPCAQCHGADYRGGWSATSCYQCHAGGPSGHPDGWMDPRTSLFHGLKVQVEGVDDCTRCHGLGLTGGTSGRSCGGSGCHG